MIEAGQQVLERVVDWAISRTPDYAIEQVFIQRQKDNLRYQSPGKYDRRFATLNLLSNSHPLIVPAVPFYPQLLNIYGSGLFSALGVSYNWGRAVDNIADGDTEVPIEGMPAIEWIRKQKELAVTGAESVPKLPTEEYMLKRTLIRLGEIGSDVDIQGEMVKFLDAMEVECDRRINGRVLTREELEILNRDSFGSPHTITLVAVRSKAQGHDVGELGQIQGRIQALRDIHPELEKGICNIPAEVLEESSLTLSMLEANSQLFNTSPTLQAWKQQELVDCGELMDQLGAKSLDKPAELYVRYFFSEIEKHITNLNN